jgi:hypothetical protein
VQKLLAWEQDRNARIIRVCVLKGVVDSPDSQDIQRIYAEYGVHNAYEAKYLWISEMLATDDEVAKFTEAVLSQTAVTKEGLKAAAQSFRGDDKRD